MPQLSRDFDERKALIRGLVNALIRNESIETTDAKAAAMRGIVDELITKAKKSDLSNRRLINSFLEDEQNTEKLINVLAPSLKSRNSGYVRMTKIGRRKGDNAMIVRIEFSDKKLVTAPVRMEKPQEKEAKPETRVKSKRVSKQK